MDETESKMRPQDDEGNKDEGEGNDGSKMKSERNSLLDIFPDEDSDDEDDEDEDLDDDDDDEEGHNSIDDDNPSSGSVSYEDTYSYTSEDDDSSLGTVGSSSKTEESDFEVKVHEKVIVPNKDSASVQNLPSALPSPPVFLSPASSRRSSLAEGDKKQETEVRETEIEKSKEECRGNGEVASSKKVETLPRVKSSIPICGKSPADDWEVVDIN